MIPSFPITGTCRTLILVAKAWLETESSFVGWSLRLLTRTVNFSFIIFNSLINWLRRNVGSNRIDQFHTRPALKSVEARKKKGQWPTMAIQSHTGRAPLNSSPMRRERRRTWRRAAGRRSSWWPCRRTACRAGGGGPGPPSRPTWRRPAPGRSSSGSGTAPAGRRPGTAPRTRPATTVHPHCLELFSDPTSFFFLFPLYSLYRMLPENKKH